MSIFRLINDHLLYFLSLILLIINCIINWFMNHLLLIYLLDLWFTCNRLTFLPIFSRVVRFEWCRCFKEFSELTVIIIHLTNRYSECHLEFICAFYQLCQFFLEIDICVAWQLWWLFSHSFIWVWTRWTKACELINYLMHSIFNYSHAWHHTRYWFLFNLSHYYW